MKKVRAVHDAVSAPIDDLVTFRALPTASVPMERLNPFIFLNHHGPQMYPPANNGLPFGPHPHRGMETVTFIIDGELMHQDSSGSKSIITAGGIQWMTAGKGLIHAEISSDEFLKNGGPLEILQLWLNLPAEHKMIKPFYKGLQKNDIPEVTDNDGNSIKIISGNLGGHKGAFDSLYGIFLSTVEIKKGNQFITSVPAEKIVFFYIVKGMLRVNDKKARVFQLVEFDTNGEEIKVSADEDSLIIFGYADPLKEPIAAQGPFVMNTSDEIMEAYSDYKKGKF
jgi:quercetin 2,3-dioxygenase